VFTNLDIQRVDERENHGRRFFIPFIVLTGAWGIHETSLFASVSLSGTVGGTPWASDQLIARPLPTQDNTNIE
jgi:hypothetical protein